MDRATVCVAFGTRPEAIKLAPIILALRNHPWIKCEIIATGQHDSLLEDALIAFGISVDCNFHIMRDVRGLNDLASMVLREMGGYLDTPHHLALMLVQGDTTSAFCSALAAFHAGIPIGHVEAGLRTPEKNVPFPEEANRRLISNLADLHFAPTEAARWHLRNAGITDHVFVTGNTGIDALLYAVDNATPPPGWVSLDAGRSMVLITTHRRESFDGGIDRICEAIGELAMNFPNTMFCWPVHPNPSIKTAIDRHDLAFENLRLLPPQKYLGFVYLMQRAELIITDSGGIQEEAAALGKHVIVTRDVTERTEWGGAQLAGTDPNMIYGMASDILLDPCRPAPMPSLCYGDGHAAGRIVKHIEKYLGGAL